MRNSSERPPRARRTGLKDFFWRQFLSLFWMLGAIGAGLLLRERITWLSENIDPPLMILISGVAGVLLPNLRQFGRAGGVITRKENSRSNVLVGFVVIVVVLLAFNVVFSLVIQ